MLKRLKPLIGALAACAWLSSVPCLAQEAAAGRPITVQDIVELESFGRAAISPDGRWAVYEKRGPYNTAARFDIASRASWTIMDLWLVDLHDPAKAPERLLPGEGPGLQRLSWSPDSGRLLITRLQGENLEVGVVTVGDRSVWWTALTPEMPRTGATAEWRSAREVVISTRPDRTLPELLRHDSGLQSAMTEAWRASALGRQASRTVIDADGGRAEPEAAASPGALVVVDVVARTQRVLVDGEIVDFALSPDKSAVAIILTDGVATLRPERVVQAESAKRQRLVLAALGGGLIVRPLQRDIGENLLRWAPDSSAVLVWAREDDAAWNEGALYRVGLDGAEPVNMAGVSTGTIEQIVSGVRADWLGDRPVVYAQPPGGGRFDWFLTGEGAPVNLTGSLAVPPTRLAAASGDRLAFFADGGLWSIGPGGLQRRTASETTVQPALPADPEQVRRLGSNEAPRREWAAATGPSGESLVIFADGATRRLGGDGPAHRVLAVTPEAALVLGRFGLEETLRLRTADGDHPLDAVNSGKRDVVLIEPVPVVHADVDGQETRSWLFLPPDRAPAEIRGVIVNVYPGHADHLVWWDPLTMTYAVRPGVLAAGGYAVLSASIPGDLEPRARGEVFARAAELSVDAALAAYPELPADRLAIYGHSFGGYAAMEIATRSRRFHTYIASSGAYDWMGYWGEFHAATRRQTQDGLRDRQMQGFVERGQGRLLVPPWEDPGTYLAVSPFLRAGEVRAPVLLVTADLDFVPMRQAESMFSALYREGNRVRLVTYWGEKHHVWSPANILDQYQQIFDWLDETLPRAALSTGTAGAPTPEPTTRTPPPP